jgi:hypothetical protein
VLIVGLGSRDVLSVIEANAVPEQRIVDLVGVPADRLGPGVSQGVCW